MNKFLETMIIGRCFKRIYDRQMTVVCNAYGLTHMELDVLMFLYNNTGYDKASDLVELRSFTKSNVSKAVESLTARNYLEGTVDPHDRRIIHLKIRPEAMEAAESGKKAQNAVLEILFNGVTKEEQAAIDVIFSKMAKNIKEEMDK